MSKTDLEEAPTPRQMGRYNLFDTPDGGIHISYTIDGTDKTEHIDVPGRFLKMAEALGNGKMSPMAAFNMLRSKS
jgi:hypothetical protein